MNMNLTIRMKGGGTVQINNAEEIVIEAPDTVYRKGTMVLRRTQIDDGTPWIEGEALVPDIENLALAWRKVKVVVYKSLYSGD
jgi:hypothetical protein